jgi:hypothetical protein
MGILKPWTSNYPGALDDTGGAGSMPTLVNGADDVIASHPNSVAASTIELEKENFAYKDNNTSAGATNFDLLDVDRQVEFVIGSVLFDGARLESMVASFRMIGIFINTLGTGQLELHLYDMGAPGVPLLPPQRRSTVFIPAAAGGTVEHVSVPLSPVFAPAIDSDEIHLAVRVYEIRAELNSANGGDTAKVLWGGVSLGLVQP